MSSWPRYSRRRIRNLQKLLNASLHKFLCLNVSFFSTNDVVTIEQRQQFTQAEECEILLWDTSQFIQISRTTNLFEHLSTKHIIDNVMINHLTGFLNKCVLAFKTDNHLEKSSSMKQKTPRPSTLLFSVSRMLSFSVIIPYKTALVYVVCLIQRRVVVIEVIALNIVVPTVSKLLCEDRGWLYG